MPSAENMVALIERLGIYSIQSAIENLAALIAGKVLPSHKWEASPRHEAGTAHKKSRVVHVGEGFDPTAAINVGSLSRENENGNKYDS